MPAGPAEPAASPSASLVDASSSPSTPSPTPTPTQAAESGLVQPRQAFNGDCSAVFTTDDVSAMLGRSVDERYGGNELMVVLDYLVLQAGAVRCTWADDKYTASLNIVVLPEDSAYDSTEVTACQGLESGAYSCAVDATANGLRVFGVVAGQKAKKSSLLSHVAAVEQLFTTRASAQGDVVPAPIPNPNAWTVPVDCVAMASSADLASAFDVVGAFRGDTGGGFDSYLPDYIIRPGGQWPTCSAWNSRSNVGIDYTVVSGGRWAEESIAAQPGAISKEVAGVDAVYVTPTEYGKTIDMFDGVNWIAVHYMSPKSFAAGAAIIAALNGE